MSDDAQIAVRLPREIIARALARRTAKRQDGYTGRALEAQVELNWPAWLGEADTALATIRSLENACD